MYFLEKNQVSILHVDSLEKVINLQVINFQDRILNVTIYFGKESARGSSLNPQGEGPRRLRGRQLCHCRLLEMDSERERTLFQHQ